jgi:hypothetical protein
VVAVLEVAVQVATVVRAQAAQVAQEKTLGVVGQLQLQRVQVVIMLAAVVALALADRLAVRAVQAAAVVAEMP